MKKLSIIFFILSILCLFASCEPLPEELPDENPDDGIHVHIMSEWTVAEEPTCVAVGLEESTCACGFKETRELSLTDHSWVDASCQAPKTCETCGETTGLARLHIYDNDAICIYCGNYAPVGEYKFQSNGDGTCALVDGGAYNVHAVIPSVSPDGDVVTAIHGAFKGSRCLRSVIIPDTVTTIGSEAFANCNGPLEVTFPDSVTEIGYGAFSGCKDLRINHLPNKLEEIGEEAFYLCVFDNLVIPDSVTKIGFVAFAEAKIASLTIGRGLETVSQGAFEDAIIDKVYITDLSTWCSIDFYSNPLTPPKGKFNDHVVELYVDGKLLTDLVIPDDVTVVKDHAFEYCMSLKSVVIPDHVTGIGWYAFANCRNIESVKIGNGIESLYSNSFDYCTSLTDLTLGENILEISDFMHCDSLELVDIPDSVRLIGNYSFFSCDSLKTVILGKGIEEIGLAAFGECPLDNIYYVGTCEEFDLFLSNDYYNTFSHDQVQCGYQRSEE